MTELGWEPSFCIRGKSLSELKHLKTTPQHYHARLLKKILNLEEFDLQLGIIRNPFERIKSEFYWQNRKTKSYPDPENWFKAIREDYQNNKYIYDNHIRPQRQFTTPETEIHKLEDNGISSAISRCQGLIKSQAQQHLSQDIALKLPTKGKTRKNEITERRFEEIREEIIDFYQTDFKLWNNFKQLNR